VPKTAKRLSEKSKQDGHQGCSPANGIQSEERINPRRKESAQKKEPIQRNLFLFFPSYTYHSSKNQPHLQSRKQSNSAYLRSCSNSCCRYGLLQPSPLVVARWIEFIGAASLPTGLRIGTSSRNIPPIVPPPAVPASLSLPASARFTPMIRIWWEREECLLPI